VPLSVAQKAYEVGQIRRVSVPSPIPHEVRSHHCDCSCTCCVSGALAQWEINLASLKDEAFVADTMQRTGRSARTLWQSAKFCRLPAAHF